MNTWRGLAALFYLFACAVTFAQTAAVPLTLPRFQFLDASGRPLAGGKVYTYVAGTSTPLATYTDASGNVPNLNPITLDAGGGAAIWVKGGLYRVIVTTSGGVQQFTADNVSNTGQYISSSGAGSLVYTAPGTGGVSRSIAAKLGENLSATDYSSLGAAISVVCAAGGGTVTIPPNTTITLSDASSTGTFGYLPYCSNLTVTGADRLTSVIKVASAQQAAGRDPMLWYVPNTSGTPLTNFRLSNLTVDWNGANNPVPQSAPNKLNGVVWVKFGSDIWIDGVTVLNHPGHQPFAFGSNVAPQSFSRVHFVNNYLHNVSDAVTGNIYANDHSSLYCQCDHSEVANNTVYNDTKAAHATAFELHMRYGRVENNGAYNIDAGANVVATVTDQRDVIYSGNTFYNVDYGFRLWTGTGFTMQDVRFVANSIVLANSTAIFGGIYGATELVTAPLNIDISQNTIHTLSGFEGNGKTTPAISLSKGSDVSIRANRIYSMGGRGVELFGVERASVDNNDISDIGQGGNTSYQDAIAILTGSTISRFAASDNRIYQVSATTTANGINVLGPITTVYLTGNTINAQTAEVLSASWTGTTLVNDSPRFQYRNIKQDASSTWLHFCGFASDQVCRIAFGGRTATLYWGLDKAADNSFQLTDLQNSTAIRLRAMAAGQSEVNSGGSGVVSVNTRSGSGTGGLNGGNGAGAETWHITGAGQPQFPLQKSLTGMRYACFDTAGNLIGSATACSGT